MTTHASGGQGAAAPMPEVSFSTFIVSLASAALVQLGEVPDPATGALAKDLTLARYNIDVLEMLDQKSRGNLDHEEQALLDSVLYELRMKYVIMSDNETGATAAAR